MATRSKATSKNRKVTTPTYTKQSFREFKKLNAPKAGRSLTDFNKRR